jgi:hypothetical protein
MFTDLSAGKRRSLVRHSVVVLGLAALVVAVAARAAAAVTPEAETVATFYASHRVTVACDAQMFGAADIPTSLIHLHPRFCDALDGGLTARTVTVQNEFFVVALFTLLHESAHQAGYEYEGSAECLAKRWLPDALNRFYATPADSRKLRWLVAYALWWSLQVHGGVYQDCSRLEPGPQGRAAGEASTTELAATLRVSFSTTHPRAGFLTGSSNRAGPRRSGGRRLRSLPLPAWMVVGPRVGRSRRAASLSRAGSCESNREALHRRPRAGIGCRETSTAPSSRPKCGSGWPRTRRTGNTE